MVPGPRAMERYRNQEARNGIPELRSKERYRDQEPWNGTRTKNQGTVPKPRTRKWYTGTKNWN